MNSFGFENRVSLTRKSEELMKTVEELSSSYAKREEFALKIPRLSSTMRTSEICTVPVVCAAGVVFFTFVGVVNVAGVATLVELALAVDCYTEMSGSWCENKLIDNHTIISNIV